MCQTLEVLERGMSFSDCSCLERPAWLFFTANLDLSAGSYLLQLARFACIVLNLIPVVSCRNAPQPASFFVMTEAVSEWENGAREPLMEDGL